MDYTKYKRNYYIPKQISYDWVHREYVDVAPIWCSVDLRDGNQSLVTPMSLEEKLVFFKQLVDIGFKEIEIGFPASSDTEYEFLRTVIEKDLVPDDVKIQVLTQSRPHIIAKTFKALDGCKNAIVHIYNSTSVAQREQVFKKSKAEILELAVSGAKMLAEQAKKYKGNYQFEYSPESFSGTEPEFALEVVNAVLEVWQPTADNKAIINLPMTVETCMPHIYASQIEFMSKNIINRQNVILSLHTHNDRGTAVADCELGLLAGAERVEGTLFGNGERTGNVDIITLAMNLYSHGIDPKLNLENLPQICKVYEQSTRMAINPRQPYSGELVFAAFSGSHQDAISKGLAYMKANNSKYWQVPYLPIDPKDVGREYDADVIRINSQSGKGGVSYVLMNNYGYDIPYLMREELGYLVKSVSDKQHKELAPKEVLEVFEKEYINRDNYIKLIDYSLSKVGDNFQVDLQLSVDGVIKEVNAIGNGALDAVANGLKDKLNLNFRLQKYYEHAKSVGSSSEAITYVSLLINDEVYWGIGEHKDIACSSILALITAINRSKIIKV